jgi:peptide methionine sulfoxide reductase msrA/msrB
MFIIKLFSAALLVFFISNSGGNTMYNELTNEEARVIIHKGTERAFTGEYTDEFKEGTYICRRCNSPLYKSDSKFHSGCGWPAFDKEIPGAVTQTPDADSYRTEITCTNCGAHLGHIFKGEGFTATNTRHCVNSISMIFIPQQTTNKPEQATVTNEEKATFAGGCFWGVENLLEKLPGVISATSGYTGGNKENPTYKEVCSGTTGHIEAVEITFDPNKISYRNLAKNFFEIHDPTQLNRQGPDQGEQYKSAVFYHSEEQKNITEELIQNLKENGYNVVTQIKPATKFWPAEEYHQDYYEKKGTQPYCHAPVDRFNKKASE